MPFAVSAAPSPLLLVLLGGLVLAACALAGRPARVLAVVVGGVCAVAAVAAGLYAAFAVAVPAWDEHPALVRDLAVLVLLLLVATSIGAHRAVGRRATEAPDEGDDQDGGGGGGSRPRPDPTPGGGSPGALLPPDPAWAAFDAARADWDRIPAGRS
jgi:hypothetical protein